MFYLAEKAGKGRGTHKHLVYVNAETQKAFSSEDNKHVHNVAVVPGTGIPEQLDQMGNVVKEAVPAQYYLEAGEDGHVHELVPYPVEIKMPEEKESDVVSDVLRLFSAGGEYWKDGRKQAECAEGVITGEGQWDKQLKENLEQQSRAALTLNYVGAELDTLCGIQREQRQDWYLAPNESGDQMLADIMNPVLKVILERTRFFAEESAVFEKVSGSGLGVYGVRMAFEKTVLGDIVIEELPWKQYRCGEFVKRNLEDLEYQTWDTWESLATLKKRFPEHEEKFSRDWGRYIDASSTEREKKPDPYEGASEQISPMQYAGTDKVVDVAAKTYRVITCIRKYYEPSWVVVFAEDGFVERLDGWAKSDVEKIEKLHPGFKVMRNDMPFFRKTVIAGGLVVEDRYPLEEDEAHFHYIPVFAKRKDGFFWGKVHSVKDAQSEINKRRSQFSDIVNKVANYNVFIDGNTFPSKKAKSDFKKKASVPGAVHEVSNVNNIPARWEGVRVPQELVALIEMDRQTIRDLMNISIEDPQSYQSGLQLFFFNRAKLQGNEYLFEAMSDARKNLWEILRVKIKRFYDSTRIYEMVAHANSMPGADPVMIGGKAFDQMTFEEVAAVYESSDLSDIDLALTESAYSPTARLATHAILAEFASKGGQVPMEILVETLPIPAKVKASIMESIDAESEAAAYKEKLTQLTELLKPMLGKGLPPQAALLLFGQMGGLPGTEPAGVPQNGMMQ